MRNGFVFDLNKCVGCEACVVACQIENHEVQNASWRAISTFNEFQHPALPLFHFSLACNHCDDPLCLTGCPAKAFIMDPIFHTVDHIQDICIGCRYCTWTCPYDAPKYVMTEGVIEKCTLCKERIIRGRKPNCAKLCPTGALDFSEIDTNVAADVPGFTDRRIWPGIKIIPLRNRRRPDSAVPTLTEREHETFRRVEFSNYRKTSLESEWPLILFTMLAALLFAVTATALIAGPVIEPMAYIALAVGGLFVSAVHLGSPLRAWRALLNIRSSWLSREIAAYTLFVGSSGWFLFESASTSVGIASVVLGLATLVSIDMVYATVERSHTPFGKSGSIVLTGLLFFAVLAQMSVLVIVLLIGTGVVYAKGLSKTGLRNVKRILASSVRIAVGIILPILLLGAQVNMWFVATFVLLGETINRAEFYLDLDVVTPRRQIHRDLIKELNSMVTGQ